MKGGKFGFIGKAALMALLMAFAFAATRTASTAPPDQVLYNFNNARGDDHEPGGLTRDTAGNLYGVTYYGLAGQAGNVFELSPQRGGGWTYTALHEFKYKTSDGAYPSGPPTMDAAGNLYGVTQTGGTGCPGIGVGCGIAYELMPDGSGGWTENILYTFQGGYHDGSAPTGALTLDSAGNLYGTTYTGGPVDGGTVYELSPQLGGPWKETVLYAFLGQSGYYPPSGVVFDKAGNLYGVTSAGGNSNSCPSGCGTVFELSPTGNGNWTEQVLHNFQNNGADGTYPLSNLLMDSAGNLYGATFNGGTYTGYDCLASGCGTVYELLRKRNGWKENILHTFLDNNADGVRPGGNILFDPSGNIYGGTSRGGTHGNGAIFELLNGSGWAEKIRHNFGSGVHDGHYPNSVALDPAGNLYGATSNGGTYDGGTVFEVTP